MNEEDAQKAWAEEWTEISSQESDSTAGDIFLPPSIKELPLEPNHRYLWEPRENTGRPINHGIPSIKVEDVTDGRWDDLHFLLATRVRVCGKLVLECQGAFEQEQVATTEEEEELADDLEGNEEVGVPLDATAAAAAAAEVPSSVELVKLLTTD